MLAVLGATGFTGGLLVRRVRELGLPLRLVGRRRDALDALAGAGEEVRVADARDVAALTDAFAGAAVVASLAGPFLEVGDAAVRAAIGAGAHYVDSSGEQAFARLVYEQHDAPARTAGVAALTSFGFDYVPGDLAARLAADTLEPVDEIVVAYSTEHFAPSAGTRRTIGHVMRQRQVAWANGVLVESSFGATTRRVQFPFGERTVVEWSGTEPLTVPRHTSVQNVRSYVRAPGVAARAAGVGRLLAPLVRASALVGGGPSERSRRRNRFVVLAEARHGARVRRAVLEGSDVYGLTAELIAHAAQALLTGGVRERGALAPAQAFTPRDLIERCAPLIRIASVEDL